MIISKCNICLLIAVLSISAIAAETRPGKCGERLTQPLQPARILIDTGPEIEQWPWVGALYIGKTNDSMEFACVVTVLSDRFVVIAANCIVNSDMTPSNLSVRLGAANLIDENESRQSFNVEEIHVNKAVYWVRTIALLKLSRKIVFNQFIQPICMKEVSHEENIIGRNGSIVGWEKGWFHSNEKYMMEANMTVVQNSICSEGGSLENSTLCATRSGMEVNNNGFYWDVNLHVGGLYVEDNGKWFIRGVAILGINQKYWEFTDIAFHLPWIRKTFD